MDNKDYLNEQVNFFDSSAEKYENTLKHLSKFDRFYSLKYFEDAIDEIFNDPSTHLVLDLGCGPGALSFFLNSVNPDLHIVGVDISKHSIEHAHNRVTKEDKRSIDFCIADAKTLPFPSETFDGVISINLLHHSPDLQVLGEVQRVMKSGGRLLLIDLTPHNPFINFFRRVWFLVPRGIKKRGASELGKDYRMPRKFSHSRDELVSTLNNHGFNITKEERKHLFIFCFSYLVKIFPLARYFLPEKLLFRLARIEELLLDNRLVRRFGHVIVLHCVRKTEEVSQ